MDGLHFISFWPYLGSNVAVFCSVFKSYINILGSSPVRAKCVDSGLMAKVKIWF